MTPFRVGRRAKEEPMPDRWTYACLTALAEAEGAEMAAVERVVRQFPLSHLNMLYR